MSRARVRDSKKSSTGTREGPGLGRSPWCRDYFFPAAALALLVILVYSNTLRNSFHLDDFYRIVENPGITKVQPLWRHFLDPSTIAISQSLEEYRPLLPLTLSFNYALFGLEPPSYHLVNIAFHLLAVVFCYLFFLAQLRHWDRGFLVNAPARAVAFFGAAIFAVHPISGYPVNYLCSRDLLMMQAFLMACLYAYLRLRQEGETGGRWAAILGLLLISLFSKANAILAPVIVFLFEFLLAGEGFFSRKLWLRVLPLAGLVALFFLWIHVVVHFSLADTSMAAQASKLSYLLTQIKLHLFYYLWSFPWPYPIRDLPRVTPVVSFLDGRMLAGLAFISMTLAVAWLARRRAPLISFLILAYWVMMSLESSIFPIYQAARPYRIYPALPYLSLLLAVLAFRYLRGKTPVVLMTGLLLYFGVSSFFMNQHFRDEKSFWTHSVAYGADEIGTMNYGMSFRGQDNQTALKYFLKSLEINPNYYLAHINLGLVYLELGEKERGLAAVRRGVELSPPSCLDRSYYWLADTYERLGDREAAYEAAVQAWKYNQHNPEYLYKVALTAEQLGRFEEALGYLDRLHQAEPNYKLSRFMAGWCHQVLGRNEKAVAEYTLAIKYQPDNAQTYANMGYALISLGRGEQACQYFATCLKLAPDHAAAEAGMARCQGNRGNLPPEK